MGLVNKSTGFWDMENYLIFGIQHIDLLSGISRSLRFLPFSSIAFPLFPPHQGLAVQAGQQGERDAARTR